MKVHARIKSTVTPDQLEAVRQLCPEGKFYQTCFDLYLSTADVRFDELLRLLDGWGYRRWGGEKRRDDLREYSVYLFRIYDKSDWDDAQYLELWPSGEHCITNEGRDSHGRLMLARPTLKHPRRVGLSLTAATLGVVLVTQHARDVLDRCGLHGLRFRPTVLVRGTGLREHATRPIPWDQYKSSLPWWELTSDIVLPSLSPSLDLRNWKTRQPFRPTERLTACSLPAELHYRRADLAALPPFDVAHTFENFGPAHSPSYRTVVSKRFYDCCVAHALKSHWAPVRIDE